VFYAIYGVKSSVDGSVVPEFSKGTKKMLGNWVIATYGGETADGAMAAPPGYKVYVDAATKTVRLRYSGEGSLFMVR